MMSIISRWMTSYKLHLEDTIERMKKGQNIHGRLSKDQLKRRESKSILRRSVVSTEQPMYMNICNIVRCACNTLVYSFIVHVMLGMNE